MAYFPDLLPLDYDLFHSIFQLLYGQQLPEFQDIKKKNVEESVESKPEWFFYEWSKKEM